MAKPKISTKDLCRNAQRIRTGVAEIKTFLAVETKNRGFDEFDRPLILFERHWFHKFTKGRFDNTHPNISNRAPGGYGTSASQYDRFSIAFGLDPNAAMKSASWGLGQVMGFNYAVAGFASVGDFVDAMKESEGRQLDAAISFIVHNGLDDELRRHDWRGFARGYNGNGYEKNDYHNKLAFYYKRFSAEPQPDCRGLLSVSDVEELTARIAPTESATANASDGDPGPAAVETTTNDQSDDPQKALQSLPTQNDAVAPAAPDFVPENKVMEAPPKDGATATTTQSTILGIAVPTGVYAAFKAAQEWVDKGYIDMKAVLDTVIELIRNNVKYVSIVLILIAGVVVVKKVFKQITFIAQMFINANPNWHNITIVPSTVERKKWYQFWK